MKTTYIFQVLVNQSNYIWCVWSILEYSQISMPRTSGTALPCSSNLVLHSWYHISSVRKIPIVLPSLFSTSYLSTVSLPTIYRWKCLHMCGCVLLDMGPKIAWLTGCSEEGRACWMMLPNPFVSKKVLSCKHNETMQSCFNFQFTVES